MNVVNVYCVVHVHIHVQTHVPVCVQRPEEIIRCPALLISARSLGTGSLAEFPCLSQFRRPGHRHACSRVWLFAWFWGFKLMLAQ